ncbi:MAG: ATP-binding protein [Bacteroidota bacterium]
MKTPLNVLIIEDSEFDASLIIHNLKKSEYEIVFERVETQEEFINSLEKSSWDIVIADYMLPSFNAPSAHAIFNRYGLEIPFIAISGTIGEEVAISLMKSGAHDYLMKGNLARLTVLVTRELHEAQVRRDHKQAELSLKESEEMYRTLLNASPEGIVIIDILGIIRDVSGIAYLNFGYDNKAEVIGEPFLQFIPEEEKKKINYLLSKTLTEGLAQNVEIKLVKRDQTVFSGEISMTMIPDGEGKPKTYMAIIRDISQRKSVEQKMIHTERLASLGEMATGIAHEINQPLNIIALSLENIFYELLTKESIDRAYLGNKSDKIFENVNRIRNIIDHIRAFAMDHDDYLLSSFDIKESIRNAISLVSEQFKHRAIKLHIDFDESIQCILGNPYKFEQVILNLLMNAKDAIEEKKKSATNGEENSISITTRRGESNIYVEVTDTGIGIKPEQLNKIMLPFFTTKEVGKGTGVGLSISLGIIKEMDGSLEVTSEVNIGTSLRIILPLKYDTILHPLNKKIFSN